MRLGSLALDESHSITSCRAQGSLNICHGVCNQGDSTISMREVQDVPSPLTPRLEREGPSTIRSPDVFEYLRIPSVRGGEGVLYGI